LKRERKGRRKGRLMQENKKINERRKVAGAWCWIENKLDL